MADDTTPTGGDAGAGTAGAGAATAAEARFTQEDLNRAAASERRKAGKLAEEHEALKTKLAGFEEAQKTEGQKAIEAAGKAARQAADAEWSAKLTAQAVDAELRLQLQAQGYDPDLAVLVKSKSTLASVEDVPEAIKTALEGKPWAKAAEPEAPRPVGMAGAPSGAQPRVGRWTDEKISQFVADNPRGLTPAIEAEMRRDMGW